MSLFKNQTGHEYEHLCANRLKRCGFSGVTVTCGSGDQGIDIIATRKGSKYGIQCKYYSGPVGNSAVQEAYAGAKYYNCDIAVVMTNSIFTKAAKELAGSTNVLLWEKDKIPFALRPFRLTKWIGVFFAVIYALALLFSGSDLKYAVLQKTCWAFILSGSIFAILESSINSWTISAISTAAFAAGTILEVILSFIFHSFNDVLYLLCATVILALRTLRLYRKEHHKPEVQDEASPQQKNDL